jgi:hypothetical protein
MSLKGKNNAGINNLRMKLFENVDNIECNKRIHIKDWLNRHSYVCNKLATHTNEQGVYRCRHHSLTGRFVVRDGDVGEIKMRFDTEKELRENIHLYPKMRMQKVTKSHRRDIY